MSIFYCYSLLVSFCYLLSSVWCPVQLTYYVASIFYPSFSFRTGFWRRWGISWLSMSVCYYYCVDCNQCLRFFLFSVFCFEFGFRFVKTSKLFSMLSFGDLVLVLQFMYLKVCTFNEIPQVFKFDLVSLDFLFECMLTNTYVEMISLYLAFSNCLHQYFFHINISSFMIKIWSTKNWGTHNL